MSPNTISKLKKKEEGSSTDEDPIIKITKMPCDGVDIPDILQQVYPPEKISKAVDDFNELEGKYGNSDYMQTRKLFVERGYDVDSSMSLRSGVLKVLTEKDERDEEISRQNSEIMRSVVVNNNLKRQVMELADENNRLRSTAQQRENLTSAIEKQFHNLSSQEALDLSISLAELACNKTALELLSSYSS